MIIMSEMSMKQMIEIQEIKVLRELDDLTGLFQILVFMIKFERGNVSNFIKDLRLNQQPMYRTLKRLTELGLIAITFEESPEGRHFKSKYYYLTENGWKLAKHFANVLDVYKRMK